MRASRRLINVLFGLGLSTIVAILIKLIILHADSDMTKHAVIVALVVKMQAVYGHFLFFVTASIVSGFSDDPQRIISTFPYIVGVASLALFLVSVWFVDRGLDLAAPREPRESRHLNRRRRKRQLLVYSRRRQLLVCLSVMMVIFSYSLPMPKHFYLGQFPAMAWHNTTILFLMPFAVGLFVASMQYLARPRRATLCLIVALALLNLTAKPNYIFAWLPVFPLAMLWVHGRSARVSAIALTGVVAVAIAVQAWYLTASSATARLNAELHINHTAFTIAPMRVWDLYSTHPILSLLASNIITIAAFLAYPRQMSASPAVRFAGFTYLVGLAVFIFVAESGQAVWDANFMWQMVPCTFILFLAVVAEAWSTYTRNDRFQRRDVLVPIGLIVQFAACINFFNVYFNANN